jgi:hypothetical protein
MLKLVLVLLDGIWKYKCVSEIVLFAKTCGERRKKGAGTGGYIGVDAVKRKECCWGAVELAMT